jgi:hypothetical protein
VIDIEQVREVGLLQDSWNRIFRTADPFSSPFLPHIRNCLVFHPTNGFHLAQRQYEAVCSAARASGERGFALSVVEYAGDFFERGDHWRCQLPPYASYTEIPLVLENALYSLDSRWGLLVSHEDHAIVGGDAAFMERLRSEYPGWPVDVTSLRKAWEGNPKADWILGLLPCIPGQL